MLATGIIEPVEESDWVSPMVVQEKKKKGEIRICVDLRKLNDACGQESYSFTDGFSGYHQIKITSDDRRNTTFVTEWGCFQYTIMPFGLRNSPAIFLLVVITTFKEFIHKFLEVYFDYWTVFGLAKHHVVSFCLMLDTCQIYQIALNLKKSLFCINFGNLLRDVVCRHALMVDPAKIAVILNLEAPRSIKQLRTTLGHMGYYRKLIKGYAQITALMEKLLKKDVSFCWNDDCKKILDILEEKMVTVDSSLPELEERV
eukprot:PITA_32938